MPVIECVGHGTIRSRVASSQDWRDAEQLVRAEHSPGDLITVAPAWADPLLRERLGDLIKFSDAGRSDTTGYGRLWALTLRGVDPDEAPATAPEFERNVGRLRVRRWKLPEQPAVLYDFVAQVGAAEVSLIEAGQARPCSRRKHPAPRGGGLGRGMLPPDTRFTCDAKRPWLWVEATVLEDLQLEARYCVYQHPAGPEPIRVVYPEVPLGERIVVYGGVYYEDERHRKHAPIDLVLRVDDEPVGHMKHRDGVGWQRMEVTLSPSAQATVGTGIGPRQVQVSFEVTTSAPYKRSFCWSARMLGAEPRDPATPSIGSVP